MRQEEKQRNIADLFRHLAGRKVWIPCRREENGNLALELLLNQNQEQYLPAFFSQDSQIGNFKRENLVSLNFQTLRHTIVDLPEQVYGIVVEPFAENIVLDRQALSDFDRQTKGMSVSREIHRGKVSLAVPGKLPDGLEAALKRFFDKELGVSGAWILLAKGESEQFPHLMFAVDFAGNRIELFPRLAEVIKPFMQPGQQFELIEKGPMLDDMKFAKAQVYRRNASQKQ